MKPWSLYYPYVMVDVQGAPGPLVDQALCLSAREFCRRTSAWVEWQSSMIPGTTTNRYEFDLPAGHELVRVVKALSDGEEIGVLSYRDVPADFNNPGSTALTDKLVHLEGNEFLVFPNPTESIQLQLAFKPALAASGAGDVLFNEYAEAIASGAKARLMKTRDTSFFDLQMASIHQADFDLACRLTANLASRQLSADERRVKKSVL